MNSGYEIVTRVLFFFYIASLFFLFCYGFVQIHLVYKYLRQKRKAILPNYSPLLHFPFVTIQLPVYNESLVVERLIDAVARFDYPVAQFEIQVLDDSTDETKDIIAEKVAYYKSRGLQIEHIHRVKRTGFKAGALQEGLQTARGEFIALFDADFVPPPDFLQNTLPAFTADKIGMVQTRWEHLNKNYSLLTHFQAFLLDAHFSIEQAGRNSAGYFINFSGTGGIWRKACMLDAGGWEADTLTEDFDISYRAQLKGWQFKYLENIGVPAELPPVMSALKTQQFRWIKGNAETARKHVGKVLQSDLPLPKKIHAFFHLTVSTVFICVFLSSFLSVPLLFLKTHVPELAIWFGFASASIISLVCFGIFHYVATVRTGFIKDHSKAYFFKTFPLYLSFSMGISLNNALAVAEGLLGIKSGFIRTPKFNVSDVRKTAAVNKGAKKKNRLLPIEIGLTAYYLLLGTALAFYCHDFSMWPYHILLAFGFGMICYFTFQEQQQRKAMLLDQPASLAVVSA